MHTFIRLNNEDEALIQTKVLDDQHVQLMEIPRQAGVNIYDVVSYDPATLREEANGVSYLLSNIIEPSGYRAYLTWGIVHKPRDFYKWNLTMQRKQMIVQVDEWVKRRVRHILIALPAHLSSLEALAFFNRHARFVEIVCPLLAAHANDLDRAKSDLERAYAWGAPEAELTLAVAEYFEEQNLVDEAMPFWERLAHDLMPTSVAMRERIAISYARLGVYPQAAHEFDYAADLVQDPEHKARLEQARDLMWKQSIV